MKNTYLNSFFALAVCSISLVACQSETENNTATNSEAFTEPVEENAVTENEENSPETSIVFNVNLATKDELSTVGISEELVGEILKNRPFVTMNELDKLLGQMENKEELYTHLFVPFNLNTTAEKDFKMIPGVGDKMAHEFEEYRPYKSIKQFRKEIGKYVDEAEVSRYESYVFVPVELNTATEADIKALPGLGDKMAHEFNEYRPYSNMKQFEKEIGKYVDENELKRLLRLVYLK